MTRHISQGQLYFQHFRLLRQTLIGLTVADARWSLLIGAQRFEPFTQSFGDKARRLRDSKPRIVSFISLRIIPELRVFFIWVSLPTLSD